MKIKPFQLASQDPHRFKLDKLNAFSCIKNTILNFQTGRFIRGGYFFAVQISSVLK